MMGSWAIWAFKEDRGGSDKALGVQRGSGMTGAMDLQCDASRRALLQVVPAVRCLGASQLQCARRQRSVVWHGMAWHGPNTL
jgi:hypothetical protein